MTVLKYIVFMTFSVLVFSCTDKSTSPDNSHVIMSESKIGTKWYYEINDHANSNQLDTMVLTLSAIDTLNNMLGKV